MAAFLKHESFNQIIMLNRILSSIKNRKLRRVVAVATSPPGLASLAVIAVSVILFWDDIVRLFY